MSAATGASGLLPLQFAIAVKVLVHLQVARKNPRKLPKKLEFVK
jgi:hypothetical protein